MRRRARFDREQRVQGHVQFPAATEQPGHLAEPSSKRAGLPRVGRARDGRDQLAKTPARDSGLMDALDLVGQGQRPLGEQRSHRPTGERTRLGERAHR